jgi:hypothetical protein
MLPELLHMLELMPQPGIIPQQRARIGPMQADGIPQRQRHRRHTQSPGGDAGEEAAFFDPYGHEGYRLSVIGYRLSVTMAKTRNVAHSLLRLAN